MFLGKQIKVGFIYAAANFFRLPIAMCVTVIFYRWTSLLRHNLFILILPPPKKKNTDTRTTSIFHAFVFLSCEWEGDIIMFIKQFEITGYVQKFEVLPMLP